MRQVIKRAALAVGGVLLALIGASLMFVPQQFLAASQVLVAADPSLMSELTAPSGILILTSLLMIAGAVKIRFANIALVIGALVYGSYGIGRLVSMALHGAPSDSLMTAMVIELGITTLLLSLRFVSPSGSRRQTTVTDLAGAAV